MARIYRVEFELGSTGSEHRTRAAAERAAARAERAARRGGDMQAVMIRAYTVRRAMYGRDLIPVSGDEKV